MRPIKLEISGLQSFSNKQIIDFDELTSLGLFGIFGETGSGKSTILDGMILALFNEIPRLKTGVGKSLLSCLNNESEKLEVKFKFALGKQIIEVSRSYQKKVNKDKEIKLEQKSPILSVDGEIVADTITNVKLKLDEYLGMNADDFTRSVVLPQGKFSEFLKLKGLDKVSMLENIFELERYGKKLSDKLKVKNLELKDSISSYENQIKGKGDVSVDNIYRLETEVKKWEREKIECETKEREYLEKFSKEKKLRDDWFELEKYIERYEILLSKKDEFLEKERELEKYDKVIVFKDRIDRLDEDKKVYREKKERYELLKNESVELTQKLDEKRVEEGKIKDEIKDLEEKLKDEFDSTRMETIQRGLEFIREYEILKREVKSKKGKSAEYLAKIEEERKEKDALESDILELDNRDNGELSRKKEIYLELEESLKKLELERERVIIKSGERDRLLEKDREIVDSLNLSLKNLKNIEDRLEPLVDIYNRSVIVKLRGELKEGESCPVCGSKEHPKRYESVEIDSNIVKLYQELEGEKVRVESEIYRLKSESISLKNELETFNTMDIDKIEQDIEDKKDDIKILKNEIESIESCIKEKELTREKKIVELKNIEEKIELFKNEIVELEKEIVELSEKMGKIELEYNNLNLELDFDLDILEGERENLVKKERVLREYKERRDKLREEILSIKDDIDRIKDRYIEIKRDIDILEEQKNNIYDIIKKEYEYIEAEILRLGFTKINEVREYYNSFQNIEEYKNDIENYKEEFQKVLNIKDELKNKLQGYIYSEERWEKSKESYEEFTKFQKDVEANYSVAKNNLLRVQKLKDEVVELLEKIEILTKEQGDIQLLIKKLEGKKFVRFLARKRLDYIVLEASKRLQKITRGRYMLTTDLDCNFHIVDCFNGNHQRECSTLSGGETFIVSLSLALALSSQLQLKGNVQLEFFFLDEGFGTLDSILLDRVIEILEEIKWKERIKIGIISHVEDLKIRMPRRLEVSSAIPGKSGSTVKLV